MKHIEVFTTDKVNSDVRLAVFSDLHYHNNFPLHILNRITKQIREAKPDYICLVGDILDQVKYKKLDRLVDFLNEIGKIAPIICVLGNHDEKSGSMWTWKHETNKHLIEALKSVNTLYLLEDDIYNGDGITFYGFNFSFNYYSNCKESYEEFAYEADKLKGKLDSNNYNVVLFHSPINIYDFIHNNLSLSVA